MNIQITEDNRPQVLAELERKQRAVLVAIGKKAEGYAKAKAPVDTGRLRSSITYTIDGDSVEITSDVEYAPYQEYGTIYITGKHFMRDAMAHHITEYIQLIQSILKA